MGFFKNFFDATPVLQYSEWHDRVFCHCGFNKRASEAPSVCPDCGCYTLRSAIRGRWEWEVPAWTLTRNTIGAMVRRSECRRNKVWKQFTSCGKPAAPAPGEPEGI